MINEDKATAMKKPPKVLKSPPKARDTNPFDIFITEENTKYYLYISIGDKLIRFVADEDYK